MVHGRHVKVLGRGDPKQLGNPDRVGEFLMNLVERLGMRPLGSLMCDVELDIKKKGLGPFEDEGGVTGVVVLSTSHCTIHTWPLRPFFVLDVYSCRDFDQTVVEKASSEFLFASRLKVSDLSASLEYDEGEPEPEAETPRPAG